MTAELDSFGLRQDTREVPMPVLLGVSVLVHVIVLIVVPLLASIMWRPAKFQRPATFQLVTPNAAQVRQLKQTERQQRVAQKKQNPDPRPVPTKDPVPSKDTKPSPKNEEAGPKPENLDELASLLNEMPSPVQASAVGNFKYPWYINNIIQKVERYWSPSSENRKVSVRISFIVFRDGTVSDIRIIGSSGNQSLDNLAVRAVTLAAPFGKMPPAFAEDRLELQMTLYPYRN